MKKTLFLLILLFTLVLTSCSEQKDIIETQILSIESNNKKIISKYGLYYNGEEINYLSLIKNKLKQDNKEYNNDVTHYFRSKYYEEKIFFSYIYDFRNIMIGYIDATDYSINNTYVTSENSSELYLGHLNDNYCIYYKTNYLIHDKYVEYFVYDYLSNTIIESDSNSNGIEKSVLEHYKKEVLSNISRNNYIYNNESYEIEARNSQAIITKDGLNIVINYDYVLNKSDVLKEIDGIVGKGKKQLGIDIFAINESLYIILYSKLTKFGSGYLIPVIFSYDIATDTFEYVGATPFEDILYIE